ncbi:fungal-specific transcription factor domain-containing protein [Thelonectria olida]|uniref:Fungal-specific transcription factor domain-containing protein n=1 Tax=Thelonectria olida TaxID=1576542 RepID=A0A9P8W1P3_9HYPO|nr:fungal-specific transcription factor domain-containing protein [Thelonectria olida]
MSNMMTSMRPLEPAGEPWQHHHGQSRSNIRRIRQACTNCRHRKTKCSGDRPRCINCRRVDRVCQYEPYSATVSTVGGTGSQNNSSLSSSKLGAINPDLLKRINTIESQLARLSGQNASQIQSEHQPFLQDASSSFGFEDQLSSQLPSEPCRPQRRFSSSMPQTSDSEGSNMSPFNTLPPHSVMQSLIDAYFLHSHNQPYSYFHEASFRDRLAYGLLPKCLVFAVLASALRFSNNEYFRGAIHEAIETYAREAWLSVLNDHMTTENCPNLHVAQATNILAIVDFTAGRTSSGWLKIGLAVRIAQDLQLQTEPKSTLSAIEQEERRRAFWSIYLLDKLVSCGQGRPPAISDNDCHVQLPCDQQTFRTGSTKKTMTLHELFNWGSDSEGVTGTFALTILAASTLGRCARHVLHQCETDDILPWDSKSEFTSLNSDLLLVEHHLEPQTSPINEIVDRYKKPDGSLDHQDISHVIFARTIFHLCHCLLNHPFLLQLRLQKSRCRMPPNFWAGAQQTSKSHALKIAELLDSAAAAGCHVQSSFYVYATSVAGSILLLAVHAHQDPGADLRKGSQQAFQILERMGQAWEHASKMHIQLLLFDAQGDELAKILDPQRGSKIDSKLEAIFWSMVNYDTMCSNPTSADSLLGSFASEVPGPEQVDFDMDFTNDGDYSSLGPDANGRSPGFFISL